MKKSLALFSVCAALALSCGNASAAVFTDVDDWTDATIVLGLNRPQQSFTDNFNIVDDGYTPGDHITSAFATFTVRDENRNEAEDESFVVELGGEYFTSGGPNIPFSVGVTVGGSLIASLLVDLQTDGILWYTITATGGDFRFKVASLQATVPDGGTTVGILGLGMLGVAGFRRFVSRGISKS